MLIWKTKKFNELTTQELYQLLKLRIDVFVVEQTCPYPELDDKDHQAGVYHLVGYREGELIACARLLPKGISYNEVSIGRVATKINHRGNGLGHELISYAIKACDDLWPNEDITIGAQYHLQNYYGKHGFQPCSEQYLEDDIPHVDMRLTR